MIVRTAHGRLQLITQPDHAQLARAIMVHCIPLASRPRRESILRAIGEHDNGWAEADATPTVDPHTGLIADFVRLPLHLRHAVWPRGIARLADDPWAAALVAQHAIAVYHRYRDNDAWTPFFAEMETRRGASLRQCGMALEDLAADYPFVRLGDLISLTFCVGWTDAQRFGVWTIQLSSPRVIVTPDLFGGADIPFTIAATEIRDQPYRSDAELWTALSQATTAMLEGTITRRP